MKYKCCECLNVADFLVIFLEKQDPVKNMPPGKVSIYVCTQCIATTLKYKRRGIHGYEVRPLHDPEIPEREAVNSVLNLIQSLIEKHRRDYPA